MIGEAARREVSSVVILGGDSDFALAVNTLKALGVKVTVYAWKNSLAPELGRVAEVHYLDDLVIRKNSEVVGLSKALSAA